MGETTSVLATIAKRIEGIPFYFWNVIGIGLFILYVKSGYSIDILSDKYSFEILVLISIMLSSVVQIILTVIVESIVRIRNRAPDWHDEFILSGIISLSIALLLYSMHTFPFEILSLIGGLLLGIFSIWALLF
jgi:hypothetical protein